MSMLLNYLRALDGSNGCGARYESNLLNGGPTDWPWLAGHYKSLLDELIKCIGRDALIDYFEVRGRIDDALNRPGR